MAVCGCVDDDDCDDNDGKNNRMARQGIRTQFGGSGSSKRGWKQNGSAGHRRERIGKKT